MSAGASFPERHRAIVDSLWKRLEAFLDDANEENLHGVRTAIRRAAASMGALPKNFRKREKTKKLLGKLKALKRRSARVRDLDTVRARLSGYPPNAARSRLVRRVAKRRGRQVRSTIALASSIGKLSPLCPESEDAWEEKKVPKRLEKVAGKLKSRVGGTLPKVLAEPDNPEALHSLRKDCKKLRYTLELMPEHGGDSELVKTLILWQDLLGAVRDGDVTIGYLSGLERAAEVDEILGAERGRRKRDYEKFARACKELPKLTYASL